MQHDTPEVLCNNSSNVHLKLKNPGTKNNNKENEILLEGKRLYHVKEIMLYFEHHKIIAFVNTVVELGNIFNYGCHSG